MKYTLIVLFCLVHFIDMASNKEMKLMTAYVEKISQLSKNVSLLRKTLLNMRQNSLRCEALTTQRRNQVKSWNFSLYTWFK